MMTTMNAHARIAAPQDFVAALRTREATLRNLASTLCRNRDRAERLLVHVISKAEREYGSFDRTSNLTGWLMRLMREEFAAGLTPGGLVETATNDAESRTSEPDAPSRRRPEPRRRSAIAAEDAHRAIDITPFLSALRPPKSEDLGPRPELVWLDISLLRIDQRYQREILRRGRGNVIRIAAEFDWRMFTPVIVSRIVGTPFYAIVDGQHRTTAAACREIMNVPCMIIEADPCQQAAAFAAINGNVTQMSSLQLHAARIAAGDLEAVRLEDVCAAAGVEILRYPVPANLIKVGQTLAVSCLASALKVYGPAVVTAALLCITATGTGNSGLLRAALIRGLCHIMAQRPRLAADPEEAMGLAEAVDFERLLEDASVEARRTRVPVSNVVIAKLSLAFGPAGLAAA
jgi:DNA-directed RNA polymerase specialized sigma24 family protein